MGVVKHFLSGRSIFIRPVLDHPAADAALELGATGRLVASALGVLRGAGVAAGECLVHVAMLSTPFCMSTPAAFIPL